MYIFFLLSSFFWRVRVCLPLPCLRMSPTFVFLGDAWIRGQRAAVASRQATNLASHFPNLTTHLHKLATHLHKLATHLPNLATHLPNLATHLPNLATHLPDLAIHLSFYSAFLSNKLWYILRMVTVLYMESKISFYLLPRAYEAQAVAARWSSYRKCFLNLEPQSTQQNLESIPSRGSSSFSNISSFSPNIFSSSSSYGGADRRFSLDSGVADFLYQFVSSS